MRDDDLDEGDEDFPLESVRAKWSMDGAKTLSEAAQKLRGHAAWLQELERDGWQPIEPVDDDWGHIANTDPTKRLSTPSIDHGR